MLTLCTTSLATAFLFTACSIPAAKAASQLEYKNNAVTAMNTLMMTWYDSSDGLWNGTWWNSANSLTTLANFAALDQDSFMESANGFFETTYVAAPISNGGSFLNEFYDDEGWWAMAWLRIYDLTGNQTYLTAAEDIFKDMMNGEGATCGGIWWSKDNDSNAAISNELYLAVGASLANRMENSDYADIATKQADWFLNTGLINENDTVNDGLDISTCEVIGTTYTYNSGVIIGGLIEMYRLTSNQTYLETATDIANGEIKTMTDDDGILTEIGYPEPGDQNWQQFKGVFVRNLAYLQALAPHDAHKAFLQANANAIWSEDRQDNSLLGADWQGPYFDATAASQTSALDCLVGAAAVS